MQWPSARTGVDVSVPAPIWVYLRARLGLLRVCSCRPVADGADLVGVVIALTSSDFRCRWLGGDWESCRKGKICMGRWMEKHSRGLGCLVLLAVTLAVLLRPVPFREFAHSDRATEFYVTAFVGDLRRTLEARPDQAEIAPLLAELETGAVSFCGRQRNISWSGDQQVYNLWLNHAEGDRGVLDAAFSLRSDGMLYTPLYLGDLSLGYACYQLKGCDLAAAVKQLNALLALPPA